MKKAIRVVVTNASSFLGRYVTRVLSQADCEILEVGSDFNLTSEAEVLTAILTGRPEVVIHLERNHVQSQAPGTAFRDTLKSGMNVLDAATLIGAKYVTVAPRSIYADDSFFVSILKNQKTINESYLNIGTPSDMVGDAKLAILAACRHYNQQYKTNYSMLVLPPLYGPDRSTLLGSMVQALGEYKMLTESEKEEKGSEQKNFRFLDMSEDEVVGHLFVNDAAIAVLKASLLEIPSGIFNVGAPEEISLKEISEKISSHINYQGKVQFQGLAPSHSIQLSGELSEKILGWKPATTISEGLSYTLHALLGEKKKTEVS